MWVFRCTVCQPHLVAALSNCVRVVQSPERGFLVDSPALKTRKRVFLVRHAATVSSEENRLPGDMDEPCSALGEVQVRIAMSPRARHIRCICDNHLLLMPAAA